MVWTSKYIWRIVGLFWILAHSSGFMFNSIRGTQYAGQDGKGGISYIAGGFQSQYQLESQIIGVACKLLNNSIPLSCWVARLTDDVPPQTASLHSPPSPSPTKSPVLPTQKSSPLQCWPGLASCSSATASCSASSASRTVATRSPSRLSCETRWSSCGWGLAQGQDILACATYTDRMHWKQGAKSLVR